MSMPQAFAVEKALKSVDGVSSAEVNAASGCGRVVKQNLLWAAIYNAALVLHLPQS